MERSSAVALLKPAVLERGGTWADLGAGTGTFTHALAQLLGPDGLVYAVDRAARALAQLQAAARPGAARIVTVIGDFTAPLTLPGAGPGTLDGLLLANALHFVREQAAVLSTLSAWLVPGGRVVLIEYDRRAASRWVPFPIDRHHLPALTAAAGLSAPEFLAERPSAFGGSIYTAAFSRT